MKTTVRLLAAVSTFLLAATGVRANLVLNGGFETGDFTGWTQFGDTSFTGVDSLNPHSGSFQAFFGPVSGIGGISQTLAVTPGQWYLVDFFLANDAGAPNAVEVKWGATTLLGLVDSGPFGYTEYKFPVVAGGPTVSFGFNNVDGFFALDDVSVTEQSSGGGGNGVPDGGSTALLLLFALPALTLVRRT